LLIKRRMKRLPALFLLLPVVNLLAQSPSDSPSKRSWMNRMLHPFSSGTRLPDYNDPKLRGLTLRLDLAPQPVKLSEVRLLDIKVILTNASKRPIELQFPNEQRIEISLLSSTEKVLTKWSDNRAFAEKPGSVLINPGEHIEYNERIGTRDLTPNTVFIAEVSFPRYPDLRIRQKYMTAP
jgi:hypothetical protein